MGAVRPEAACGEPDDVGVDRDLDGGVAGAVVLPAWAGAEHAGQGLMPGAGGEVAQPLLLARDGMVLVGHVVIIADGTRSVTVVEVRGLPRRAWWRVVGCLTSRIARCHCSTTFSSRSMNGSVTHQVEP